MTKRRLDQFGHMGYAVDNFGDVWTFRRRGCKGGVHKSCKKLTKTPTRRGHPKGRYLRVGLMDGNGHVKIYPVHKLVMLAFRGPCPPGKQIRHLDGDPTNNRLSNLKYGTCAEDYQDRIRHGTGNEGQKNGRAKLSKKDVKEIRMRRANGETGIGLAKEFGVTDGMIGHIVHRRSWKHIP